MKKNKRYTYDGPVYYFGKIHSQNYKASTYAVSQRKAISNLAFRYKDNNNFNSTANIRLDPKCLKEE